MSDDQSNSTKDACCGSCQNSSRPRPRLVIGVFTNAEEANGAAKKLRANTAGTVNVLLNTVPLLAHDLDGLSASSLMGCGRLYEQIAQRLESGSSIVIVDAHTLEEQLGISRVFLEAKCDMLLTHDGSGHAHPD